MNRVAANRSRDAAARVGTTGTVRSAQPQRGVGRRLDEYRLIRDSSTRGRLCDAPQTRESETKIQQKLYTTTQVAQRRPTRIDDRAPRRAVAQREDDPRRRARRERRVVVGPRRAAVVADRLQ